MEFSRSVASILIHQQKYALELIADMGLAGTKPVSTPMELNLQLTTTTYDDHIPSAHNDPLLANPTKHQRLIGRLLYLTSSRPDISFTA